MLPVVAAIFTVRLLSRFGAGLTLSMSNIGFAAACVLLSGLAAVGPAAAGYVAAMMLVAVNQPARNVLSQEIVEARWRTTSSAMQTIGTALGWASTAVAGGFLIARFGFNGVFALGALCAATAAVLAYGYARARTGLAIRARATEAAGSG